jgi:NADPH-dependent 2,4-dienoyl-CoA reductase/sulfur reductase-like enzyme
MTPSSAHQDTAGEAGEAGEGTRDTGPAAPAEPGHRPERRRWLRDGACLLAAGTGGDGLPGRTAAAQTLPVVMPAPAAAPDGGNPPAAASSGGGGGGSSSTPARLRPARVVVVGGGYAGATAARYLRLLSNHRLEVLLIEPQRHFLSCPMSNLVLTAQLPMRAISHRYDGLRRAGVELVHDRVLAIDTARRQLRLAGDGLPRPADAASAVGASTLPYDRLVLAPGIELDLGAVAGLPEATARGQALHAWKAGEQTLALRQRLAALPDGGRVVITVPPVPYRCPPGPYERASLIADWLRVHRPRAKLLVLDANPDVVSKGALFKAVWAERYGGLLEYRPDHRLVEVDGARGELRFDLQEPERADLLNVLPPMRAPTLLREAGLCGGDGRWADTEGPAFAARQASGVHVIGDSLRAPPGMPKSGHMANAQAKVLAAALVAELNGQGDPGPLPLVNTCYSFVDATRAVHVASVHGWDAAQRQYLPLAGAGGLSAAPSAVEADHAWHWARTIWADMLA